MTPRIEDYALIGDLQTAALVGRNGSIDWLCRFDRACFAALLGTQENGHGASPRRAPGPRTPAPGGATRVIRWSWTYWETRTGTVKVTDFMPQRDKFAHVMRIVEGVSGTVDMSSVLRLRFDFGSVVPWVRRSHGHRVAVAGPDSVWLRSEPPVKTWLATPRRPVRRTRRGSRCGATGRRRSSGRPRPSCSPPPPRISMGIMVPVDGGCDAGSAASAPTPTGRQDTRSARCLTARSRTSAGSSSRPVMRSTAATTFSRTSA
ncbi:hypothetical protein SGLAM104S_10065 [Streptomyces glaucescens]